MLLFVNSSLYFLGFGFQRTVMYHLVAVFLRLGEAEVMGRRDIFMISRVLSYIRVFTTLELHIIRSDLKFSS